MRAAKGVYAIFGKRLLDLVVGIVGLVFAAPVLVAAALLVRVMMGRPVLFRQWRPGLAGQPFRIIKLRTMKCEDQGFGNGCSDEERLTNLGQLLRATSIDELPEFWNVLRGEMSLVGPRPLLMEYLPLYNARQAKRHEVRPGITGWAQVNGRNALGWEEKFELDVWYVENLSFALDVKIIWKTLLAVVQRHGISAHGEATMPRFTGSAK